MHTCTDSPQKTETALTAPSKGAFIGTKLVTVAIYMHSLHTTGSFKLEPANYTVYCKHVYPISYILILIVVYCQLDKVYVQSIAHTIWD